MFRTIQSSCRLETTSDGNYSPRIHSACQLEGGGRCFRPHRCSSFVSSMCCVGALQCSKSTIEHVRDCSSHITFLSAQSYGAMPVSHTRLVYINIMEKTLRFDATHFSTLRNAARMVSRFSSGMLQKARSIRLSPGILLITV